MVLAAFLATRGAACGIVQQRGSPDDLQVRAFLLRKLFRHMVNPHDVVVSVHGVKTGIPGPGVFQGWHKGSLRLNWGNSILIDGSSGACSVRES